MITKENTPRFVCADGSKHDTLELAQIHDIDALLLDGMRGNLPVADYIVARRAEVLDILLTDGRRRKRIGKTPAKRKKSAHERATELLDAAAKEALAKPITS